MPRYRQTRTSEQSEDVGGLAGWLFTDLLLGLSFIFLASAVIYLAPVVIAEDAESDGAVGGAIPCVPQDKTFFDGVFDKRYSSKNAAAQIGEDLKRFADSNNLRDFQVAVAIIQGHYDTSAGELPRIGGERAAGFYEVFSNADSRNFPSRRSGRFKLIGGPVGSSASSVPRNGVRIEAYFLYDPSTC